MRVGELMTTDVCTVGPETSLKDVAVLMTSRGLGAVPVVDDLGRPIGILTEVDLIRAEARPDPRLHARRDGDAVVVSRAAAPRIAADAMSTPVITLGPDADVADLVGLMLHHHLTRVPVVGDDGRLVGIVSRRDLLRPLARPDADIAAEIRSLADLLPAGTLRSVSVDEGRASVAVAPGTDTALIERLVRTVPGAVEVRVDVEADASA